MEMVASEACQEVFGRADSLQPGKRMGARLGRSWTGVASRGQDHWRHWGVGFNWLDLVAWRSMIIGDHFSLHWMEHTDTAERAGKRRSNAGLALDDSTHPLRLWRISDCNHACGIYSCYCRLEHGVVQHPPSGSCCCPHRRSA